MNEHEKRLRVRLKGVASIYEECTVPVSESLKDLDAALAQARADALEEAVAVVDRLADDARDSGRADWAAKLTEASEGIRVLDDIPPDFIPVAKVREVLGRVVADGDRLRPPAEVVDDIVRRLGVPLDGEETACARCHHARGQHCPAGACGADHCTCDTFKGAP